MSKGPLTQPANADARMGVVPIHFAAVALQLMLTLCVNGLIHY